MKRLLIILLLITGMMVVNTPQVTAMNVDSVITDVTQSAKALKDSAVAEVKAIDTSSTFKIMYSDFKQGIVALASSLKVGTEHVYGVLVRQQIVKGVVYLIIFIMGISLIYNWIKQYKSDEEWGDEYNPTGLGIIRTIQIIVAFILFIVGIFHIDVIMTGFINPEYGAIQDVIEMVKTLNR